VQWPFQDLIRHQFSRPYSSGTVGLRNGVTGYTIFIIIIQRRTRFWALRKAKLILGGENGREIDVRAGDVALLPTGTGHCRLHESSDFLVVARIRRARIGIFAGALRPGKL
jgi:hypothetical protein